MIYICIPTHNEQQTVGVVLWKLRQVLTDFPRDYQLLVADDASTDKTADVLEPYTRVLPLTVIRSNEQQGSAASLEMLLREAVRRSEYPKRDVIVTLQADFSEEPDDLVPLVKRLEAGADVAAGNKVSTSKDARARRFARSLARFFMRRQKWPEGVLTPFDGYRAYRLYAVRKAIEERGARRLIRHDGWAGHAELLQAVLPHARRVDVVDVDDRPDRLQRPRREKPFASAMQVRVMAAGTEPTRLVGVEELDRIALTASRSRERAAVTAQSIHADRAGNRTNGSRSRQTTTRRDQSRTRSRTNGAARSAPAGNEARDRSSPAQNRSRRKTADERPAEQRSGRQQQRSSDQRPKQRAQKRSTRPEEAAGAATPSDDIQPTDVNAEGAVAPETTERPKRKRRRRRRGGQGRGAASKDANAPQDMDDAAATGASEGAAGSAAATESGASDETGAPDESGGGAPKKRRRRGGRRGGRGRRKPRPEGAAEPAGGEAGGSTPAEAPIAESGARADND